MKVALIGGTGYVGSYICDELIANDHTPRILVREGSESKVLEMNEKVMFLLTGDQPCKFWPSIVSKHLNIEHDDL